MNTYENPMNKDTILSGALVGFAIVWAVLAAVHVPADLSDRATGVATATGAATTTLHAGTSAGPVAVPAPTQRLASNQVS
jgi:hypothetical protein